ncbi:type II secretion system F family protein [Vibrio owensii]|uniref:type II secretion system F family protein n=1 Tax=Vibrio owensii TaxID=696485 RepID=UPI001E5310F2|nr:type II secretion system F family protein [Vibrio owensii]
MKSYASAVLNQDEEQGSSLEQFDGFISTAVSASDEDIKRKFEDAGVYNFKYAHLYMPAKYGVAAIGCSLIWLVMYNSNDFSNILVACLLWLIATIMIPDTLLNMAKEALNTKIRNQLPYLLDLLAVCVQTGLTLEASLAYLAKELRSFDKDLGRVVGQLSERSNFVGLDKALEELYEKFPSNEMRSFVMTLRQSLKYGSSIYDILVRLSSDIRQVSMLSMEEKIGKLSAKMSVPLILFIMFPIVILIVAPGIMRMLG